MTTDDRLEKAAQLAAAGRAALAARQPAQAESLLRRAVGLNPADALLRNDLGRALNNLRRHAEAVLVFRDSIRLEPGDAETHCYLGHVLRAQGDLAAARSAFAEATRLDPDSARAWRGLATTLTLLDDLAEATVGFRRALEIEPDDVETLFNLGSLLEGRGRQQEAAAIYKRICTLDPELARAHGRLADVCQSLGKLELAERHYARALELGTADQSIRAGAALLQERRGRYAQGWQLLDEIVDNGEASPDVCHAAARLLRRLGRHRQALQLLEPLHTDPAWQRRPQLYFTLGEIYDELGQSAEAFRCFQRGNSLKPPSGFDPDRHRKKTDGLIAFFGSSTAGSLPRAAAAEPTPVFIVGMPRSGTSLVEQILASHPLVHAGGERQEIPRLVARLTSDYSATQPYPYFLAALTPETIADAARGYRESFGPVADGVRCITDKLPVNFLELGLIELLFPNARIVHCRRHPLDVVLSNYFQNFDHRSQPFATDLQHIAAYYEQYERIMTHWKSALRLPLHEIGYERMVGAQEPVTRELLEFLGLPWDAACLRFFETRRDVSTSSYAQVRQPVYASSVHRHERYLDELGDLVKRFAAAAPGNGAS